MPSTEYENRSDSVLAWKKAQKLGRFDPNAPSIEQQKILASEREVEERGKIRLVVHYALVHLPQWPPNMGKGSPSPQRRQSNCVHAKYNSGSYACCGLEKGLLKSTASCFQ